MKIDKRIQFLLMAVGCLGFTYPLIAQPIEMNRDNLDVEVSEEDEEDSSWEIGASAGLRYLSKQITYGLIDNPHGILLPCVEISYGNDAYFTLAAGAEAFIDATNYGDKDGEYTNRRHKYQELDLYLTLSKTWNTEDILGSNLETSLTYLYEYHPKSMRKAAGTSCGSTQWLFLNISADGYWLVPSLMVEYNLDDNQETKGSLYATFDLSHTFDLSEFINQPKDFLTLTPKVGIGIANKDRNMGDFDAPYGDHKVMFRDAYASLDLNIQPVEGFSITPTIGCHQQVDRDAREATGDEQFVAYFGIGISYEL